MSYLSLSRRQVSILWIERKKGGWESKMEAASQSVGLQHCWWRTGLPGWSWLFDFGHSDYRRFASTVYWPEGQISRRVHNGLYFPKILSTVNGWYSGNLHSRPFLRKQLARIRTGFRFKTSGLLYCDRRALDAGALRQLLRPCRSELDLRGGRPMCVSGKRGKE